MTTRLAPGALARTKRDRVVAIGGGRDLVFVATKLPNVVYCSGYRSMAYDTDPGHTVAVVFDCDEMILVGPVADFWDAAEFSARPFIYMGYGRFFFDDAAELTDGDIRFEPFSDFDAALAAAIARLSVGKSRVAFDADPAAFASASTQPALAPTNAERIFRSARSIKSADEIGLLRNVTKLTEQALSLSL